MNSRAGKILSNATSLNTSTAELADEITMATSKVDQLQQTVEDDKAAVAVVSSAANDAVDMAADLRERIVSINVSGHAGNNDLEDIVCICLAWRWWWGLADVDMHGQGLSKMNCNATINSHGYECPDSNTRLDACCSITILLHYRYRSCWIYGTRKKYLRVRVCGTLMHTNKK